MYELKSTLKNLGEYAPLPQTDLSIPEQTPLYDPASRNRPRAYPRGTGGAEAFTSSGLPTFEGLGVQQNPAMQKWLMAQNNPITSAGLPTFKGLGVTQPALNSLNVPINNAE